MGSEIVSSGDNGSVTPLGDRMDATIGEASSGIGALLSELVRRSLKTGVSEIGESLVEFAEEQVEAAVEKQMPAIAEAADAVAQSTSKRIVSHAVEELHQQSARQQEVIESRIEAAESSAFDRSRDHLAEVLVEVRQSINEARTLASDGNDATEQKIEELREKARQTWHKLKRELVAIHDGHERLRQEYQQLRSEYQQQRASHSRLVDQHQQLRGELDQVGERHRLDLETAEQRIAQAALRSQLIEQRLSQLEQPRGLKRLLAKFRRPQPEPNDGPSESAQGNDGSVPRSG
jgi:uncharacterized phage infection (PIP) family protein YhgE